MKARLGFGLVLGGALLLCLWAGWHYGDQAMGMASAHAAEWRQGGLGIWLAFIMVQTLVAGFGFLPASLTGLAIGFILGPVMGFAIAALGTLSGACLAFALARSAFRPLIVAALAKRGFEARGWAGSRSWRFVFMLRLSPVLPFAPTSYALGIMGVTWRDFVCGTLAALPSLAAYVWLGAAMTQLSPDVRALSHPLLTSLFWIGMAATLVLVLQLGGRMVAARQRLQMQ